MAIRLETPMGPGFFLLFQQEIEPSGVKVMPRDRMERRQAMDLDELKRLMNQARASELLTFLEADLWL